MRLSEAPWSARFVAKMPGDPVAENFVRTVRDITHSETRPTPVKELQLLGWADGLATELGIDRPTPGSPDLAILGGNHVPVTMRPYAARYGGHQFGHWARQLGDGRAITLGEISFPGATRSLEFQLKGAGLTPYSRTADGRAVLRSSLREFLCSEAMHFLGVPTTRALSLVSTGEPVVRDMFYDGNPRAEPGAIVCRVAPSFLRFGNFEILARTGEHDLLRRLADYLITEHYPEISLNAPDPYGKLLDEIARRTATMVAHWMRVGFVHGVMNTDNMSALGLTIDYGPYGWLEPFDPDWTPNTTDAEGRRYAYGRQPGIAFWNTARLCEAFSPLIPDEARLRDVLTLFEKTYGEVYSDMLAQKLGIVRLEVEDEPLIEGVFELLEKNETDFLIFFRNLAQWKPGDDFLAVITPAFYSEISPSLGEHWVAWSKIYGERIGRDARPYESRLEQMNKANPKYALRNYLAQNAITAAVQGDTTVIERLLRVLKNPYAEQPGNEGLATRRPEWARSAPGCSALSCSS